MNQMSNRVMFDMNNNRRKNNKNSGKPGVIIAIIAFYLISQMAAVGGAEAVILIITIAISVLAVYIAFKVGKKRMAQGNAEPKKSREDYCKTCSDEFVYNNRQIEYNEFSAEEHFVRDRQRRMRQLDDFLKNGLIDKTEYMVLRSHYEK